MQSSQTERFLILILEFVKNPKIKLLWDIDLSEGIVISPDKPFFLIFFYKFIHWLIL